MECLVLYYFDMGILTVVLSLMVQKNYILQKQSGCFLMSCSLTVLLIGNTSDILKIVKFVGNLNQAK